MAGYMGHSHSLIELERTPGPQKRSLIDSAIGICGKELQKINLNVSIVGPNDYNLKTAVKAIAKTYTTPPLDPNKNDLNEANCFWMIIEETGYNRKVRRTVGVAGARLDNIKPLSFPRVLEEQMIRLFDNCGQHLQPGMQSPPPAMSKMEGKVVYLGDFFAIPEIRGPRFNKSAVTMALYLFAMKKWSFDYLYLFINKKHADKGYFTKYNLPTFYPAAVIWKNPPNGRAQTDFVGILKKSELLWMVDRLHDNPDIFIGNK